MDTATSYLGLALEHPVVVSACPLSDSLDGMRRLEDAGAAAVVMFSLFEEQLRHESAAMEHFMSAGTDSFAESLSYFPHVADYTVGPDAYLDLLSRAASSLDIPVIASLNGTSSEGWIRTACQMQEAGAAAIELNVYYIPASGDESGEAVERRHVEILQAVKEAVSIPVALKLSPFFSATAHMARQLDEAGADGLVLFNRFYQPDLDLEKLDVVSTLDLSSSREMRLPLLWIAILHGRLRASLAATTGVETHEDVVKYIMAGADAVMTASALLRHGVDHLGTLVSGLGEWLERRGYESVAQIKGSMSQRNVEDPTAFERANYIRILERYKSEFAV